MPYCKLSSGIVNSSIWSENLATRVVWITFLAIKNDIGFVEGSRTGLARIANVSIDEYDKAILVLESPDNESKNSDNEGRRIERVNGGWQVLNHDTYRDMKSDSPSAVRQRRHRESDNVTPCDMSHPVTGTVYVSVSESVSESYNNEKVKKRFIAPVIEEVAEYCELRQNKVDPQSFIDFYESKGWIVGKSPMKDWKAAVRTWEKNNYNKPAQKPTYGRQEVSEEAIQRVLNWRPKED